MMFIYAWNLSLLTFIVDVLSSFFFFFKQKTAYEMRISDWSSDVCSSDLLQVVVDEADAAETAGDDEDAPDVAVGKVGPQQGRDGERDEDEHAPHGRRALLGQQMPFGAVAANRLALALPRTQPLDHRRPDEEGDGERRDHRAAAAKGEVAEQVEQRDAVGERDEQVVEHAARVPTVRSTT